MIEPSASLGYKFDVDGLAQPLAVLRFQGEEALSQLPEMRVTLACDDEALAFANVVGRRAVLTFGTQGEPRRIHGIVSRFEQGDEGEPLTTYHATLVPEVWRLLLGRTSRVFEKLSVPDVVRRVLERAGLPSDRVRFVLHGKYEVREHCLQYRESDWAFISRLLEEEGIFYFLDEGALADASVLVIADTPFAHPFLHGGPIVPFRGARGALSGGEHITGFRYAEALGPGRVTLRGYSYQHPNLALASDLRAPGDDTLEVYDHHDFEDPKVAHAELEQRARVALEASQTARRTAVGAATSARFAAGSKLTLTEHPRDAFNGDYLLTKVLHLGGELASSAASPSLSPSLSPSFSGSSSPSSLSGPGYTNRFTCLPADVAFRPERRTPKPIVRGVQTATVVGPAGEEIHTDAFGRVKVQFHWDREGRAGEDSSCWVRVSQTWAGSGYGAMFVPRVGQEVVVDFIEGDLDRPIVIGGVYHGTNLSPYPLPADKSVTTLKTRSTPGGAGSNELRIEDQAGAEEIFVHAQRDLAIDVEHDEARTVHHDETLLVENDRQKTVEGHERSRVGRDRTIEVGGSHAERIAAEENIQVGANSQKIVTANQTETTGASRTIMVGANHTEIIGQGLTIMVGASKSEAVSGDRSETVGADSRTSVEGDHRTTIGGARITESTSAEEHVATQKLVTAGSRFEVVSGTSRVVIEASGKIIVEGPDVEIRSSGAVKVRGSKLSVKATGAVQIKAAGRVDLKGRRVEVN